MLVVITMRHSPFTKCYALLLELVVGLLLASGGECLFHLFVRLRAPQQPQTLANQKACPDPAL